ncbi:MAG: F0F1 ATP synthase subunit gamma [Polyangiales bacterium]
MDDLGDMIQIERRMTAVHSVKQVVSAIWALARAQQPLVEQAAAGLSAYLDQVDAVVDALAGAPRPPRGHPAATISVVIGPERPWCGAMPRQVLAQVPREGPIGLVGARLAEAAESDASLQARLAFALPGAVTPEDAEPVARRVAEQLLQRAAPPSVRLFYPAEGGALLRPVMLLGGERERRYGAPSTLSPWSDVLRAAVFEAVTGRLAVVVLEALRSEVRARVVAAEQAKRACDARLAELELRWRVERQEQITAEILEVVSGHRAAQGRQR